MDRYLILEDGTIFKGKGFGHSEMCVGELVFTTGMTGYQESITDQSYNGQIITFTYPLIGNTVQSHWRKLSSLKILCFKPKSITTTLLPVPGFG